MIAYACAIKEHFTCFKCKDKYIPNITGCPDEQICYECMDKEKLD
jgi:hypothetical protein